MGGGGVPDTGRSGHRALFWSVPSDNRVCQMNQTGMDDAGMKRWDFAMGSGSPRKAQPYKSDSRGVIVT